MTLALVDRRRVRRSVIEALRARNLCMGDVVALDALVDPCIAAFDAPHSPAFEPLALRAADGIAQFAAVLSAAVAAVAGTAYDRKLRSVGQALAAIPVRSVLDAGGGEPLDEVDVLIDTWVERVAASDRATALHSRAVGAWCHRIGSRLALAPERIVHVARCGTIHDVGKMLTPIDILLAARPLDGSEWDVMRRHVVDGWNIVATERHLTRFAPAVRGHHERFDGRGYPDKLRGGQIDLATRIVTVADSFNAMIADRPYRAPMSPMIAIAELERHRGTQFDPDCVDAMIDVVLGRA